ncbi:hypothetical protein ACFE04_011732 [Oxalis oulophora]
MGQAFRRATGSTRFRTPTIHDPPPPSSSGPSKSQTVVINHIPSTPPHTVVGSTEESKQKRVNVDNMLEEKDTNYDALLNQMVGRIKTKPGGKPEMGERAIGYFPSESLSIFELLNQTFIWALGKKAFVVQKSSRPMPKLRNTTTETGRYEGRPAPPGTLNVAQLKHIMLLHQGKADDHVGPMEAHQIAAKYRLDVAVVQNILQFQSLPPEEPTKQKNYQ